MMVFCIGAILTMSKSISVVLNYVYLNAVVQSSKNSHQELYSELSLLTHYTFVLSFTVYVQCWCIVFPRDII